MGMFMGGCPLCWDKDCNCDPAEVQAYIEKSKQFPNVTRHTTTLDDMRKQLGPNPCDGSAVLQMTRVIGEDVNIPDIILAGTDGDDYDVLERINRNIKIAAVLNPHDLTYDEANNVVYTAAKENDDHVFRQPHRIAEASEDTLKEAYGDAASVLTPENKHWILREMGFKGLGGGKWKHILFDETIEFDLQTDTLIQLAFKIHKTGYKAAHTEWASQQKTAKA